MTSRKEWLHECRGCKYLCSDLTPNSGPSFVEVDVLRRKNFETLLDRIERITPVRDRSILEVGCSTGLFLDAAQRRGARVLGIEPVKEKADIALSKGLNVVLGFFPEVLPPEHRYDLIVFNDVFEHLPDPGRMLEICEHRLNAGGLLVLNLPCSSGLFYGVANLLDSAGLADPLERLWQKSFPSPHISYFNSRNLQNLVQKRTSLGLIHQSSLRTLTANGLHARIRTSTKEPMATLIFIATLVLVLFQSFLPADILLQIYKKQ
jgi:SAM-dependent methyltransferase